ncbi:MAG: hypothetical protein IJX55_08285 [Clostridia bacterium]|nr:hypothetical protein [Clostridia bacterium]
MKKITAILLLVSILASAFVSCGREEPQEEYVNDRYFYETLILNSAGYNVIVEFDIVSKSARIPCPDPLCDHGEGCLVSHVNRCKTSKNCLYFYKDGGYYAYNPAKNEMNLIFESGNQVYGPGQGPGNTVYFTVHSYDYDDTGMLVGSGYDVYRYDEQTYKLEKLNEEKMRNDVRFNECLGDKIFWTFSEGYYTTDLDFKNKTPYSIEEISDFEINSRLPYSGTAFECYRKDKETGEKTLVFPPASSYRYANYERKDAFFYTPAKLVQYGVDEKTGEPLFAYRPTNTLVYINAYDASDTYTWEFPSGKGGVTAAFMHADNHREVGDYVAFPYNKVEYDEAGGRHTYGGIFVVNVKTKESFTLLYEEESHTID